MSETPLVKYDYPLPSDLIAEGANNIKELAGDVESSLFLASNKFTPTSTWSSYPDGQTLMNVSGDGWPYSSGIVMSYRTAPAGTVVWQYFFARTTWRELQKIWTRIGYNSSGTPTWSGWQVVASVGTAEEESTGTVSITPTANAVKAVKVSFPSSRFSKVPRVFVQYEGTQPDDVAISVDNRTTTAFTAYVYRKGTTTVTFKWHAIVMSTDLE